MITFRRASQPSFNGSTPDAGSAVATPSRPESLPSPRRQIFSGSIAVRTTSKSAGRAASTYGPGTVVATVNSSSTNPFTLTAPGPGRYTVNAGFLSPSRRWDSIKVNLTLADVSTRDLEIPGGTYKLDQNYPNPFNPATTISYSLARDSRVTLKIYNLLGELVSTVVNDNRDCGILLGAA